MTCSNTGRLGFAAMAAMVWTLANCTEEDPSTADGGPGDAAPSPTEPNDAGGADARDAEHPRDAHSGDATMDDAGPPPEACFSPTQNLDAAYEDGARGCERVPPRCISQEVRGAGECDAFLPGAYFVQGLCLRLDGCECVGKDCDHGFASTQECESAYAHCEGELRPCGGWHSYRACEEDEYCAYRGFSLCGATDGSAACEPRPESCDDVDDPVCGCDGQTYENACVAAMAGTGFSGYGSCTPQP